ncbi:hypothetical protein [Microbacterium gorillae]|uniref:YobI family P-loop NTPase n=1 Tax=Microbacterium gorillae TaxID=1231063 RepID=UPI003D99439D
MTPRKLVPTHVEGSAPNLKTLAPRYNFSAHGVYFTILKSTIESSPDVHNIALAGTYGAGKSSVLREIARTFPNRVVEVSLLTLGSKEDVPVPTAETNPAAASKTNRIQKEIVKQLLYKQKPTKSSGSRFHRIVRHNRWAEAGVAAMAAAIAVSLGLLFGLDVVTTPVLGITFTERPHLVGVVALFLVLAALAAALAWLVRAFIRGRIAIDKVTAGPATITLPSRSASYFDEYLDEIIYFFESNKNLDIVIIEDLDRFNDPNIFESLHSLNGILNAAKQLGGRDVRFIYAVRDSVFERLGRDELEGVTDEARAELIRANRTKFFELVVPVVPFITHRNARDLMASELDERGHKVSKDLIDLAARHLADMRLIHNIINEYEVFKHRLLDVALPVPELTADRLFALVLFKNAHMADFENIRHGSSSLDTLWEIARDIIRVNADRLRRETRALRTKLRENTEVRDYAAILGSALTTRVEALVHAPGSGLATTSLAYNGAAVDDEELQSPEFWRAFVAAGAPLTVQAYVPGYNSGTQAMQLSTVVVETLTGMPLDLEKFESNVVANIERDIAAKEEELASLVRMTWFDLANEGGYKVGTEGNPDGLAFAAWASAVLPSQLASDLVTNGFITSYFPLHMSSFYGTLVRPRATTYVMRFVDNRKADPDFELDSSDVEAILWSEGASVLFEKSMLNVDIVDYLLESRAADAKIVMTTLMNDPDIEEFIDRYLESGTHKAAFIALLATRWPRVFEHLVSTPAVDEEDRMALIDVAIAHRDGNVEYPLSPTLRKRIESDYRSLPSLTADAVPESAKTTAQFIDELEAVLPDLDGLPRAAVEVLRGSRSYLVTQRNLEVLIGGSDISLDALGAVEADMVEFVAETPRSYLEACRQSEETKHSAHSSKWLKRFLVVAGGTDAEACSDIINMAHPEFELEKIDAVPATVWGPLFRYGHAKMTFENVSDYVDDREEVDDDIAIPLTKVDELAESSKYDEESRQEVALAIINSPSSVLTASQRVTLALSLDPGTLPTAEIEPRAGKLVGMLLEHGLLFDDADAFASRLMVDWETQAYAVARSTEFGDFVSPTSLDGSYVALLLADDALASVHYPVVQTFTAYPKLPVAAHQAYAERALKGANYTPKAGGIKRARQGGLSVDLTLQLLAKFKSNVSHDELREIVRLLGAPWSKLADPGHGRSTPIPYSPHARDVLEELQSAGVVRKITRVGDTMSVTRKQK